MKLPDQKPWGGWTWIKGAFHVELDFGAIPRPRFGSGWELNHVWLSFEISDGHSDGIFSICWMRDLKPWELLVLERLAGVDYR